MFKLNKIFIEVVIFLIFILFYFLEIGNISLLVFIAYNLYLYLFYKKFILKYFYIFFLIISNILGVYVIEYPSSEYLFLYEIQQYSDNVNALLPLTILMYVFIIFLYYLDLYFSFHFKEKKISLQNFRYIKEIKFSILIFLLILFLRVINKPFFLFGYDRFAYNLNILTIVEKKIVELLLWLSPVLIIRFKDTKILSILNVSVLFIYLFWIGNKFSIFFLIVQLLLIVLLKEYDSFSGSINKLLNKGFISFIVLFLLTILHSTIVNNRSVNENLFYVENRLAQQGQLWWAVYQEQDYAEFHLDEFNNEIDNFFVLEDNNEKIYRTGMFKAMFLTTPEKIVINKISQGSRYASSTAAIFYYYFNYPVLFLIYLLYALVLSFVINLLIRAYTNGDILSLIINSKISIVIIRSFSNTDLHSVFSIENLFLILVLVMYSHILRKRNEV